MYDTEKKNTKTNKKRNIYRENGPERKKKDYEISRMKKGPIDINIKIKRVKSTSGFFFILFYFY